MKKISETIVFFGSGPVAAKSLVLLNSSFNIEAVITKPRPDHHRGSVPILETAEELALPVYTARSGQSLFRLINTQKFSSKISILIDFGIIVPKEVIDYFPLGIINSHFSLLPEWRGADPITFSILSGQKQTGVSLMLLVAELDEGPLLAQAPLPLKTETTNPDLTEELIELSYEMLKFIIPKYIKGNINPYSQNLDIEASYSRKLTKVDGVIDWTKPADQIEREIRAFAGWPKSRTRFGDIDVIILKARVVNKNGEPGSTDVIDKLPIIYCGNKALEIELIQPASKQKMTGKAFLSGYKQLFMKKNQ